DHHAGRNHASTTAAINEFPTGRNVRRKGSAGAGGPPTHHRSPRLRSIRSSLNRTFGGTWSTGFTRATSICGKLAVVPLVAGIVADSCAYAAIDHAAAIAPNRHMNSRLLIQSPRRRGQAARAASRDRAPLPF